MVKIEKTTLIKQIHDPSLFIHENGLHPQVHAKELDKMLGLRIPKVEVKLLQKYRAYDKNSDISNKKQHFKGTQTWIGLHPQALQTPYSEIFNALMLFEHLNIKKIVDIGAGYGRVGLVMNAIFPYSEFLGFEILKQRWAEANRIFEKFNLANCKVIHENVLNENFQIPSADIYFMYDFSEMLDICTILDKLSDKMENESYFLITNGDRLDHLLKQKYNQFWILNGFLSSRKLKIFCSNSNIVKLKNRNDYGFRYCKIFQ